MNDAINALFEVAGAFLLLNNCRVLYLHKRVQGVSVFTTIFFTGWGFWNLFFYPANHLWLSFAGGIALALANLLWVTMACYYSLKPGNLTSTRLAVLTHFRLRFKSEDLV